MGTSIEGVVYFSALDDVLCLLMYLVADAVCVRACCCDKEKQRLHSCIARTLCHNIIELSVRLGVQLIENNAVDIKTVLAVRLG